MFLSRHYAQKLWTNHERRSAQARAFKENKEYILPARLDDTEIPGVPPTIGYVDIQGMEHEQFIQMIIEKLGKRQTTKFLPPIADRLYKALNARTARGKSIIINHAQKFFETLCRMNDEERLVVFTFFAICCPSELPNNVHVNINLLCRHTEFSPRKIKRILGNIRSLGFSVAVRDDTETDPGQIGRKRLLVLEWWDMSVGHSANATNVASEMIIGATMNYCEKCGWTALERLDFATRICH